MCCTRRSGFTLVELLVVIGIIAVLISVLLPALGAARRQSQAVKCLTALREIGNAFQMYASENKGWYPPSKLTLDDGALYSLDGFDFRGGASEQQSTHPYWFNFINKYVSKNKAGRAAEDSTNRDGIVKNSVLWGCPNWEGYQDDFAGGTNRLQIGYGMNGYPTFSDNYPRGTSGPFGPVAGPAFPPLAERSYNDSTNKWSQTKNRGAGFVKQGVYGRKGATRALVADSRFWLAESGQVASTGVIVDQLAEVNVNGPAAASTIFFWRHGKLPASSGTQSGVPVYPATKGKIGYNILYCDNHVATATEPQEAYRSIRMKFPG